jgi:hypothetical protein
MEPQRSDWVQAGHLVVTLQIWQISLKILGHIFILLLLSLLLISLEQVVVQKQGSVFPYCTFASLYYYTLPSTMFFASVYSICSVLFESLPYLLTMLSINECSS